MLKIFGFTLLMVTALSTVIAQNNPSSIIGTNLERGEQLRILRLAVSCNGEYTKSVGGVANAKENLMNWLDEINEIYGREFCVRFELVPNNDLLIYSNPRNDPWPNMDGNMGCDGADNIMNIQASVIDEVIGVDNYDFSHVILGPDFQGGGCGGGFKSGYSGMFDIPVTRHEIGHQFSQAHTINNGSNENYEPENGGWTIQGGNKYGYAHSYSFYQLADNLRGFNSKVGKDITTGNTIPSVSAGEDVYIPINTPFELNATANDPDPGDHLTYSWDGLDGGLPQEIPVNDDTQGALFMRLMPSNRPTRSIPSINDVIANRNIGQQEQLPSQEREMNLRVTVNDNHTILYKGEKVKASGISSDDVKITVVNNGGAFEVTTQNNDVSYSSGTTQTIRWKVAGTNEAPINCTQINIKLSIDGGLSYPYTLASGTANDGMEKVYISEGIPQTTSKARIKVECNSFSNVRFFDVSQSNFTINSDCKSQGGIIYPTNSISAATGSQLLNLSPDVIFEPETTNEIPFKVDNSDPKSIFGLFAGENDYSCVQGCCEIPFVEQAFTVDQTGTYQVNFQFDQGAEMASLYQENYNPADYCANFMLSSSYATPNGVGSHSNQKIQLEAGKTYFLVVHRLFSSNTISGKMIINSRTGGSAIMRQESNLPPDSNYAYTYAAVDANTGEIKSFSENADFRSLSGGKFQIYGVSYNKTDLKIEDGLSQLSTLATKDRAQNLGKCLSFSQNYQVVNIETCNLISVIPTTATPTNEESKTFSQTVKIIYQHPPGSGSINLNGRNYPITGSPQFVTLSGLPANENSTDIIAYFTEQTDCKLSVTNVFKAPSPDNREQRIIGEYRRLPIENDYHIVYLKKDEDGELIWSNKAGVEWKARYKDGTLTWDASSPYGETNLEAIFEMEKEGSRVPVLKGFRDPYGDFYQRTN